MLIVKCQCADQLLSTFNALSMHDMFVLVSWLACAFGNHEITAGQSMNQLYTLSKFSKCITIFQTCKIYNMLWIPLKNMSPIAIHLWLIY